MISRRFFASLAMVMVCTLGYCCGPYWYYPEEYRFYRVYDGKGSALVKNNREENIKSWKLLYPSVDAGQIEELVYKWDLSKLVSLQDNRSSNAFADAICSRNDTSLAEYLTLAKQCEVSCSERASKWYYPFKDDPDIKALEAVISKAESLSEGRLYERYLLQEIRALFSLSRYDDIINLWEVSESKVREGIIRDMIIGYVAGASYRTGDKSEAIDYYFSIGDVESVKYCFARDESLSKGESRSLLTLFAERCPDSPEIPRVLQETFQDLGDDWHDMSENHRWYGRDYKERQKARATRADHKKLQEYEEICFGAASRSKSPAVWYYSAAWLEDLLGKSHQASALLAKAEKSNDDSFLGESIKVFRIYIDAKTSVYNEAYEQRLFSQLSWLDGKIISELDENVKQSTSDEPYLMHCGFSYYYWNDMLRKILIGEVCPRMEDAGRLVMALRLLNMADNRLVNYVNRRRVSWLANEGGKYIWKEKTESMSSYRAATEHSNSHDYSNYLFNAMDEIPVASLERYALSAGTPATPFEKFLDDRSYIDKDYLYELIGTRYLRLQDYRKAEMWLSKVSVTYQDRTNVKWYMTRNPFILNGPENYSNKSYKLFFAKEMNSLQRKMTSSDPDTRGEAMVKMGTGMRSSFTDCWALTQYHKYYYDSWIASEETLAAIQKADDLIAKGLSAIKDPEKAAKAYLSQYLYQTVAEKYPDTKSGKMVRSQCDKLIDYKRQIPQKVNNDGY